MTTTSHSSPASTNDGCCATTPVDVCNLPAPEKRDRIEMTRSVLLPLATAQRDLPEGFEWDFDASPETRAKLDELVAFERMCCSGLEWNVLGREASALTLRVEGPGAREAFAAIVGSPKPASGTKRFATAAGLGVSAAFVVCCLLPIGLVALLGAAAAPLAGLDNPLVIGASALIFGTGAWVVAKRREQAACADC